jgi:hypothetical protein
MAIPNTAAAASSARILAIFFIFISYGRRAGEVVRQ